MRWPAQRISQTAPVDFGMYQTAARMGEQGIDLIHLEVGRPSFDTPTHIKQATKAALDAGMVHYGDFLGNPGFREALSRKLAEANGIEADPDEILVTNGLTHGAFATCMAALDPGDEVIVFEPYYPQHLSKIELAGGRVVPVPLGRAEGFRLDPQALENHINRRTRMIVLVNPANPTGRVFTTAELEQLAEIAVRHDLLVMSDEVYELIVYDEHRHVCIATLPGMRQRTVTLFAFTKAYAMDGWRLGYAVAPRAMMPALLKVTTAEVAHVNVFIQEGGRAAIEASQNCVAEMLAEDRRRRDLVHRRLNRMPGVRCPLPEGAIYAFPDISALAIPSERLARQILNRSHVVTEAGSFYGQSGEGHLRICFGSESYERLAEAMDRLEEFFVQFAGDKLTVPDRV